MPDTKQVIVAKKLEQLTLWKKDGMLVVSGRGMKGLKHLSVRFRSEDGTAASKPSCPCPAFQTM